MFKKFILTLKQYAKIGLEQINNHKLRNNILHAIPFWFGAFICGIVAVMYAKLFEWVEDFSLILFQHNHAVFFIISPLAFVLAWWVVKQWAPYARGSGIPQVTAAIELNNKKEKEKVNHLLSLRISLVKNIIKFIVDFWWWCYR